MSQDYKPIFPVGSLVVVSGNKRENLRCIGQVVVVIPNGELVEYVTSNYCGGDAYTARQMVDQLIVRNQAIAEEHTYIVLGQNHSRPTLSETIQFIPDITDEQFEFINSLSLQQLSFFFPRPRYFTLPESSLLDYDANFMNQE